MSAFKTCIAVASLMSLVFLATEATAYRRVRWYGSGFRSDLWRHGYWFHGAYVGRAGWWWVVGPTWYYYPEAVYPYPSYSMQPAYIAEVGNVPPPPADGTQPAASAPRATTAATASGPAQAFTYYCEQTKSYFPTTNTCAGGWIATPVKPPN